MKEIQVNKTLPIINMNFDEVKNSLLVSLEKYKGLVVTEDNLKDCKAEQKDLSKLKKDIDTYRKSVKKELEQPIKNFEGQCKELYSLVEKVETPIKINIKKFDDEKRLDKVTKAKEIIDEVVQAKGLKPDYAIKLTIKPEYGNVATSIKAIRDDIEYRAGELLIEQQQEEQRIKTIKATIRACVEGANKTLKSAKLKVEDYDNYVKCGSSISDIINQINREAELIRATENNISRFQSHENNAEVKEEPIQVNGAECEPSESNKEPIYSITFTVTGEKSKLMWLSGVLKQNGYDYRVDSQHRINADS